MSPHPDHASARSWHVNPETCWNADAMLLQPISDNFIQAGVAP